jgi:hypothetical protein
VEQSNSCCSENKGNRGGSQEGIVEAIRDPDEIQKLSFDMIKNAEEEILIFF